MWRSVSHPRNLQLAPAQTGAAAELAPVAEAALDDDRVVVAAPLRGDAAVVAGRLPGPRGGGVNSPDGKSAGGCVTVILGVSMT